MRNNLIALAVTVTLAAGTLAVNAQTTYTDINSNWAESDIETMTEMGVMTGFNDGQFHPDAWVTRAEFGNMSVRLLGLPPSQISMVPSLQRVTTNTYGYREVQDQSLISAYPSGVFRPENPLRRAEVMAGLAGTINRPLVSEAEANQILGRYQDASQVPANLRREVATAIKYDLIETDPELGSNILAPDRPVTRAELAAMLGNLNDNRDIAIVQNGQLVTSTTTTTTTTTTSPVMTSTTTGTNTGVGSTSVTGVSAVREDGDADIQSRTTGDADRSLRFWEPNDAPFRNAADTIEEFRMAPVHPTAGLQPTQQVNLPANTTFTGTVAKAVYSEYNRPGDPVMLILDHTIMGADGNVVAPAGSRVLGRITDVTSNNQSGDEAKLGMTFHEIILPDGRRLAINAVVNNTSGIITADQPQGVVYQPSRSTAALRREISTSQGALYGTSQGKVQVLETPFTTLASQQSVRDLDARTTSNIILGVGDKLQLRVGVPTNQQVE